MPYYCTVPRCTSMAGKAKNVSFHQFPRDEELAKLWNNILKRGKPYTKYSKVCSLHFTPEDYTITSVGKNKGQWRTLRKDAIPSQNLPSESPTPYQRKQWGSWSHNAPTNVLNPTIQQQVAQAIYMQTMLAMQAAGTADFPALTHTNDLPLPGPTESFPHTSTTSGTDILKGKQTNTNEKSTSYKCTECSKCFKDPDVFILHKRSHINNERHEKENFNLNLTLQANPILANLLKTNTENSNIFDNSVFSMENLLITAIAANMEGYMRSFTSMVKNEEGGDLRHDKASLGCDKDDFSHDGGSFNSDQGHMSHSTGSVSTDRDHVSHDTGSLGRDLDDLSNDADKLSHDRDDLSHGKSHLTQGKANLVPNRFDLYSKGASIPNGNRSSKINYIKTRVEIETDILNHDSGEIIHDRENMNQNRGLSNNGTERNNDVSSVTNTDISDRNRFRDRIIELYRNNNDNDRSMYYVSEHNDRHSYVTNDDGKGIVSDDRGILSSDRAMISNDKACISDNENYSQGTDEPICDSDLN